MPTRWWRSTPRRTIWCCSPRAGSARCRCGGEELTQKEVAEVLGISQSYISRLEKRIIVRLRTELSRMMA